MPNFFVPHVISPAKSEEVYATFRRKNPYGDANAGRLFRIGYTYNGQTLRAEVGKDLPGLPKQVGNVLAIIESAFLVTIHTTAQAERKMPPLFVSPSDITVREYFDNHCA
jgi:hypothetical protein